MFRKAASGSREQIDVDGKVQGKVYPGTLNGCDLFVLFPSELTRNVFL